MFLNELCPGDSAEGYFILESILVKTASNGKPFLSLVLGDRSGTMEAKVWDYRGPIGAGDTGAVAYLKGSVSEFRGASQLTIDVLRLADASDRYPVSDLVPAAPIDLKASARLATILVFPTPPLPLVTERTRASLEFPGTILPASVVF